jgi:hypothetical protein
MIRKGIGIVLMPIPIRIWIGINMEIRIRVGIQTMRNHNIVFLQVIQSYLWFFFDCSCKRPFMSFLFLATNIRGLNVQASKFTIFHVSTIVIITK